MEVHSQDIIYGVSIQQTFDCAADNWEYAILGLEALTLIVGVGIGFQVNHILSETFKFLLDSKC